MPIPPIYNKMKNICIIARKSKIAKIHWCCLPNRWERYAENKTADALSRHASAVLRKIREVIGNSLASKRSLLHSSPQLAYGGELSSKTLRNYLDVQQRTRHNSTRGKTIF